MSMLKKTFRICFKGEHSNIDEFRLQQKMVSISNLIVLFSFRLQVGKQDQTLFEGDDIKTTTSILW